MAGANRPFIFRFFFDSKDAKRGADEVADSLEGIGEALDGVSAQVGADLDGLTHRLRKSSSEIGKEADKVSRDVRARGKTAGGIFGKGFLSNFGETIGSGNLGLQDLVLGIFGDLVQDADQLGASAGERYGKGFKGKAMSFITGPMGLLAGAAGVGIGIALLDNVIQGMQQREAEFKAKVQEIFDLLATVEDSISRAERYQGNLAALTSGGMSEDLGRSKQIRDLLGLTPEQMFEILGGSGELPADLMKRLNRRVGNPGEQAQQEAAANALLDLVRERARAEERALDAKREQAALDAAAARATGAGTAYNAYYGGGVPYQNRTPRNG